MKWLLIFLTVACYGSDIPAKPQEWDEWTYSQKVTWRGLNPDPRIPYDSLVNKVNVKEVVKGLFLVAKTLYATDRPESISLKKLPRTFLMKANNASSRGVVVIDRKMVARHKRDSQFEAIPVTTDILRSYAKDWLETAYAPGKEKQYSLVKPMILFEEFLENIKLEVEIFCFYGKALLIELFFTHDFKSCSGTTYFDLDWNVLDMPHPWVKVIVDHFEKPSWMDELVAKTEAMTKNIDHVRVDYFLVGKDLYFGEFTFTPFGGDPGCFSPEYQEHLGRQWVYPEEGTPQFGQIVAP